MNPSDLFSRIRGNLRWGSLIVTVWVVVALAAGWLLSWLSQRLLRRIGGRTPNVWTDQIIARLGRPLAIGWSVIVAYVSLPWLDLTPAGTESARHFLAIAFIVALFWVLLRSIDVADQLIGSSSWGAKRAASKSLIALAARAAKIAIVILGGVTILSKAGYPVGSLIAGLGIGGLALALGAQKTLENVFGAFSMAVDEPFHLGDFVSIDGVLGNIESVGLRSTRIRTLDRTLVAIPNGKLAEMRTETFAARDRLRLACTVKLVYQTTAAQMQSVLGGLEKTLRDQPKIWPDAVVVRLKELATTSLDIEVMAWFTTVDYAEFQLIRQEILLRFMEVVEAAGTTFAYAQQTLHVGREAQPGSPVAGMSGS